MFRIPCVDRPTEGQISVLKERHSVYQTGTVKSCLLKVSTSRQGVAETLVSFYFLEFTLVQPRFPYSLTKLSLNRLVFLSNDLI